MRSSRLGRLVVTALVTAVTACSPTAPPRAATPDAAPVPTTAPTGPRYVAMGDSAAAAPLVPDAASPTSCFKSTNNYPSVLARNIGATSFTDVTCSGATTDDLRSRSQPTRSGPMPPQLDAVTADTELVTITVGVNDIALASSAARCRRTTLDEPPCTADLAATGADDLSDAIDQRAADWSALIEAVKAKAPDARVILVGYGTFVRPEGCFPDQPINPVDAAFFQGKLDELDMRQQRVAADEGIEYFDPRSLSGGHDACAAPADRWVEGFVLSSPAAPLHPNGKGAKAFGDALMDYVS